MICAALHRYIFKAHSEADDVKHIQYTYPNFYIISLDILIDSLLFSVAGISSENFTEFSDRFNIILLFCAMQSHYCTVSVIPVVIPADPCSLGTRCMCCSGYLLIH